METGAGRRNEPAYLTVYLALIMAVLISLCLALIEGARSNAIRLEAECVTDIGLNSIFAEYHRELFEQYNLFAIDSAYGCGYPEKENTNRQLCHYIEKNLSLKDVFLGEILYKDFLALELKCAEVTGVTLLTDEAGQVFRRRAVEAVQDDVGLALLEDISEWVKTVEKHDLNERDVLAEKQKLEEELTEYEGVKEKITEKEWKILKPENVLEEEGVLEEEDALKKEDILKGKGVLKQVIDNSLELSNKAVLEENLLTTRLDKELVNGGNMPMEEIAEWEELTERFFFQEYLLKYMGRYDEKKENSALDYQIEYLISGKCQDVDNLNEVVNILFLLRMAANATYLLTNQEKCAVAELCGVALAALIGLPEIGDLLKAMLIFAWVYTESLYDVRTILAGGNIPLLKNDSTWHYDIVGALFGENEMDETEAALIKSMERKEGEEKQVGNGDADQITGSLEDKVEQNDDLSETEERNGTEGLCYADYLRIFMMFTDLDTLTYRAMDMVEEDIRLTPGNGGFRLDGCYDGVEVRVEIESAYGYSCNMVRRKRYSFY